MYDGSHAPSREELLEYGAPTDVTFGAFKWVLNGERAGASQAHDALAEAGTDGKAVAKYACCHVHYRCWVARIDGGIDGPLEDDIGDGGNDDEDDGDEGSEVNEVCCAWLAHLVQQHSAYPAWLALALGPRALAVRFWRWLALALASTGTPALDLSTEWQEFLHPAAFQFS